MGSFTPYILVILTLRSIKRGLNGIQITPLGNPWCESNFSYTFIEDKNSMGIILILEMPVMV